MYARCFDAIVNDLRSILRVAQGKAPPLHHPGEVFRCTQYTAIESHEIGRVLAMMDTNRKQDSKVHMAVDTLEHLLDIQVIAANAQERAKVRALAQKVRHVSGQSGHTGLCRSRIFTGEAAQADSQEGMQLHIIKRKEPKKYVILLPPLGCRAELWLGQPLRACYALM